MRIKCVSVLIFRYKRFFKKTAIFEHKINIRLVVGYDTKFPYKIIYLNYGYIRRNVHCLKFEKNRHKSEDMCIFQTYNRTNTPAGFRAAMDNGSGARFIERPSRDFQSKMPLKHPDRLIIETRLEPSIQEIDYDL